MFTEVEYIVDYDKRISDAINIFNDVLTELNKPSIFDNPDIGISKISDSFFIAHFYKGENHLDMLVWLGEEIEIHLDMMPEAFYWNNDEIKRNREKIRDTILMLLTSGIKTEYHGSKYRGYRKVYFIYNNGKCVDTLELTIGLFCFKTKRNYKIEEYAPFYDS